LILFLKSDASVATATPTSKSYYNSACAAAGQLGLMSLYETMFSQYDISTSQLLVTCFDFENTERRSNIKVRESWPTAKITTLHIDFYLSYILQLGCSRRFAALWDHSHREWEWRRICQSRVSHKSHSGGERGQDSRKKWIPIENICVWVWWIFTIGTFFPLYTRCQASNTVLLTCTWCWNSKTSDDKNRVLLASQLFKMFLVE